MQVQPPQRFAEYLLDLDYFLRRRRYVKELDHWCDLAIANFNSDSCILKGRLLLAKSFCLRDRDDNYGVISVLEIVIGISEKINDSFLYADAISFKGIILVRLGEYDKALSLYEDAGSIYGEINNIVRYIRNLNNRAQAEIRKSEFEKAGKILDEALILGIEKGCTRDLCVSLNTLGFLYHSSGDFYRKIKIMNESKSVFADYGDVFSTVALYDNLYKGRRDASKRDSDVFYIIAFAYKKMGFVEYYKSMWGYIKDIYGSLSIGVEEFIVSKYGYVDVSDLNQLVFLLDNAVAA